MIKLFEQQNRHMEHLEDLVFNDGVNGTRQAINYLQSVRDTLAGHSKRPVNMTVKWDGAPAIFCGIDPSDGKFFVAKKGIFNKNPVVYKTDKDIDLDTSGDLAVKLKVALRHFRDLGITGVVQGDLLYTHDTISHETIAGVDYITFQPNTIVYAIPADSVLARQILRSKIGVVWHTTYHGNSFETMKASFGKPISPDLNTITSVWHTDATFRDVSGVATFTDRETKELTAILSRAGQLFNSIPAPVLNTIKENGELLIRVKAFTNTYVRAGKPISNPSQFVTKLIDYVHDYYQKELDKKKTAQSKNVWKRKQSAAMSYFARHRKSDIVNMIHLYNCIIEAKMYVVRKLNQVKTTHTFLRTQTGFKPTTPEGFVAIDHIGRAVKLIDRLEFSRANFSADVIKGWQR